MTHPQPTLSESTILHPADLKSNTPLTTQIRTLINAAFARSRTPNPQKWEQNRPRFPTPESYNDMLVDEAVVALIYDEDMVVACAAVVPWKGGWANEGAGKEEGWEIKAVAVHGEEKYLHKGLAIKVMGKLEEYLVGKEKEKRSGGLKGVNGRGCLTLWILAAECINGVYWRKRGYREVRRTTEREGTWGCLTSFELVVLRRGVEFEV